jgi:hypothetical protein
MEKLPEKRLLQPPNLLRLREPELNVFDKRRGTASTYVAEFNHAANAERPTLSFGDCDWKAASGSNGANV